MKYETKLTLCIAGYLVGTIAVLKILSIFL